jgi:hypothetical protein
MTASEFVLCVIPSLCLEMQVDTRLYVLKCCTQNDRMDYISCVHTICFQVHSSKRIVLNVLSFSRPYRKKSS